jgi:hypothetical protein
LSEGKIVITGTGRAGTTLLVAILTDLGMDTGFRPGIEANTRSGGLEGNIERPNAPRVVKAPALSVLLREVLVRGNVEIEHVIIPVRDLDIAAASRVRVAGYGRNPAARGGLWKTRRPSRQREALALTLYELIRTITEFDLPHTFLDFPRFSRDAQYTHGKLGFLVPEKTADDFRRVMDARYDASEIREEPLTRGERLRTTLLAPIGYARRIPARLRRPSEP